MVEIELGNVCDSCAIDWMKIYIDNSKINLKNIHYKLVVPSECEECDGEAEE